MNDLRVLHISSDGTETVHACASAMRAESSVYLDCHDDNMVQIIDGTVLVLGDSGKCVHRWRVDA